VAPAAIATGSIDNGKLVPHRAFNLRIRLESTARIGW